MISVREHGLKQKTREPDPDSGPACPGSLERPHGGAEGIRTPDPLHAMPKNGTAATNCARRPDRRLRWS